MSGVRHVVTFMFRDEATEAQIAAVSDGLATLPGRIPEIRGYTFGRDLGLNAGNHDFAVVADFESLDGYLAYRDHPAHRALLAEHIAPILASRASVQIDT